MKLKCKDCGGVFVRENGTDREREYLCDSCFVDFLQGFIKKMEDRGGFKKYIPFLKKLLTQKLIERQEKEVEKC